MAKALGITFVEIAGAWPRDTEQEMVAFYGNPGDGHVQIVPPYQLFYDGKPVEKITVHGKISAPVLRVLNKTLAHYGPEGIDRLKLNQLTVYDGCFNDRPKRGGTSRSVHAYAAALDWCAEFNQLRQDHTTALFAKPEYVPWWTFWESEGATSLGRARDFDWMHVQFAEL